MKKIKIIIYLLVIIIGLGWLFYLFKDRLVKRVVEKAVTITTGLRLEIDNLNFGIAKTYVEINNLRLFNPKGYKEPIMFDIPRIYVDYDFGRLLKKDIHIEAMQLDLKELMVIKDKSGNLNLNALKPVKEKKKGVKEKETLPIKIDNLNLKIAKVIYKDYSKNPDNPWVEEFVVGLDEKYTNIIDLPALVRLIVAKSLYNTTIGKLVGLDLSEITRTFSNVVPAAKKTVEGIVEKGAETFKKLFGGEQAESGK